MVAALLFAGCDFIGGSSGDKNVALKEAKQPDFAYIASDPLSYLNDYRRGSGLASFKFNSTLAKAAQNHADYSVRHKIMSHDESAGMVGFTGTTPSERAGAVGYAATGVLENIAYKDNSITAIDGLFSAIYHRFAFLNLSMNEVGWASSQNDNFSAYVFIMGNSFIEQFCKKGITDGGAGLFYRGACVNEKVLIRDSRMSDLTKAYNAYVKFPDAQPVLPYFSGEVPDPFPECKITANPVSIEFSEKVQNLKMDKFEIYHGDRRLENLKIIDKQSDINAKFSAGQFAAFSRDVFDFGSDYTAVFSYFEGGKPKRIKWNFKTKELSHPYFVAYDGDVLAVDADKTYEIFFRPRDCNDKVDSFSYRNAVFMNSTIKQSGVNTIAVSLSGFAGSEFKIQTNGGEQTIKLRLKTTSPSAQRERQSYIIKAALMIIGVSILFGLIGWAMRK